MQNQMLLDFLPLLAFFVANMLWGAQIATIVLVVATILQVAYLKITKQPIKKMHLISAGLVLVFGVITILLNDEEYLQWKSTVVLWLFAVATLISHFIGQRKPLIQHAMEKMVDLERKVFMKMSWQWIAYFVIAGLVNIVLIYSVSFDTWTYFKVFGLLIASMALVFFQMAAYVGEDNLRPEFKEANQAANNEKAK